MPATAAAYGLDDPFDARGGDRRPGAPDVRPAASSSAPSPLALAAYNAGPAPVAACDCVPAIPETQAYVARILGLDGRRRGDRWPAPALEVRLVD